MVVGIESVGEIVTGGMAARAVEPEAGEGRGHDGPCLNCGAALTGDFCHVCGQRGHVHRTLGAFWHDIAHSVLHFDGKIWRTLPLLAWRPGELTRRYVEGERARFVSPMALFLFSVFLMFAIFNALGGPFETEDDPAAERAAEQSEYRKERAESIAELRSLQAKIEAARRQGTPTTEFESDMADVRGEIAQQTRSYDLAMRLTAAAERREAKQAAGKVDGGAVRSKEDKLHITRTGWPRLDAALTKAEQNPSLLLYKIQSNAYKFSWALIPISVPFVWLLFLHRRRYRQYRAYDHTVFVTYSIAFMSLGVVALTLLRPLHLGDVIPGLAISFVPPIHMYRQLRGAYRLSRLSALWRTLILLISAFLAAGLFTLLLVALGAFG